MRVSRFAVPDHPFDIAFRARQDNVLGQIGLGHLVMTPAYYVHTLEIPQATIEPKRVVEALTMYANGFAVHARDHALPGSFAPSEILFHVSPDNAKMRAYVESKGATAESAILYRLPL